MLAEAKFPVIVAGGGVVMCERHRRMRQGARRVPVRPVVNSYLHNDSFPASHALACGPLGYQGSKAAMGPSSRADVVLALGTRLGPFGTLPQHGIDYWPKRREDHPGRHRPPHAGAGEESVARRSSGDAKLAAARTAEARQGARRAEARTGRACGRAAREGGVDAGTRQLAVAQRRKAAHRPAPARCRNWPRRCRRTRWSRPTSATCARCRTATCSFEHGAVVPRGDELRQLRLLVSRRASAPRSAARTARRSPMSATAPGA